MRDIVIATPEKLDFALRADASLIDDVGLVILDEGHMIGPTEREIRYETLVQRLLRRLDAPIRRIVCLSAILPQGAELDELTAWMRNDREGLPVRSTWRPTRQRFGALRWLPKKDAATGKTIMSGLLNYDLENNGPYVDSFVTEVEPRGREQNSYPRGNSHLTIFSAWNFVGQGKRTLIYSTQANWVEAYGKQIVELHRRGYLSSLLENPADIQLALEVGREWLGKDHPAVKCLGVGVAIHHGKLPSPFLRELEILLSKGVLKVVVASPTLAQGLNLNAAVLLVPQLVRFKEPLKAEEFANVAGRAGRAFVDTEGLIIHTMFDSLSKRMWQWKTLVASVKERSLKSGLIQLISEIIQSLGAKGVLDRPDAFEYLANAREAWSDAPNVTANSEKDDDDLEAEDEKMKLVPLAQLVERLDAVVFGLVEALDAESDDLPVLLDEALKSSLWARQIVREPEHTADWHRFILRTRANVIWKHTNPASRQGHFAMGVGLEAGSAIDQMAPDLNSLLDLADSAAFVGKVDELVEALSGLAERLLSISPFIPDKKHPLPANWKEILKQWVSGVGVEKIGPRNMRAIEEAFVYRLVWAMECIRTRRVSQGWKPADGRAGAAAAALETGVPEIMMAILIRSGLPSRQAAIAAVNSTFPLFLSRNDMLDWLRSQEITELTQNGQWPTPLTAPIWRRFWIEASAESIQRWSIETETIANDGDRFLKDGTYRVRVDAAAAQTSILMPDFTEIGPFHQHLYETPPSVVTAQVKGSELVITRIGIGEGAWF